MNYWQKAIVTATITACVLGGGYIVLRAPHSSPQAFNVEPQPIVLPQSPVVIPEFIERDEPLVWPINLYSVVDLKTPIVGHVVSCRHSSDSPNNFVPTKNRAKITGPTGASEIRLEPSELDANDYILLECSAVLAATYYAMLKLEPR